MHCNKMFSHTHVYTAQKIIGNPGSLLIYGSVLPDIAVTKISDWNTISQKAEDFRSYLAGKDKNYVDLGLGMMLHEFTCGIDRFTHASFDGGPGYAFKNSETIIKDVSACCGINPDEAKVIAHNFIEAGVEFLIIKKNPYLPQLLKKSIKEVDMVRVGKYFSTFYGLSEKETIESMEFYNQFLIREDYSSVEGFVKVWKYMIRQLFGKEIDSNKTAKIIEESIEIVKPSYKDFLSKAIEACKQDVKKYI